MPSNRSNLVSDPLNEYLQNALKNNPNYTDHEKAFLKNVLQKFVDSSTPGNTTDYSPSETKVFKALVAELGKSGESTLDDINRVMLHSLDPHGKLKALTEKYSLDRQKRNAQYETDKPGFLYNVDVKNAAYQIDSKGVATSDSRYGTPGDAGYKEEHIAISTLAKAVAEVNPHEVDQTAFDSGLKAALKPKGQKLGK